MNKNDLELRKKSPVQIRNKKASFEYTFIDTYTAGIQLTGTEIKSIRMGKASLVDTYCYIIKGEMWIKGMNISPYFYVAMPITRLSATASCYLQSAKFAICLKTPRRLASPSCLRWCLSTIMAELR